MTVLCASSLNDRPLRNRSPSRKSFDPKWRSGRNVIGVLMDIAMGVEVSGIGDLHRGRPFACNFALVYTGVIVFGPVNILHGPESRDKKAWFLDQLLAKYGKPDWTFDSGYPLIDQSIASFSTSNR